MNIRIDNKRDGGTIYLDDKRVGYIESYHREHYVRFANCDDPEYMGYGTTEPVARIKFKGYREAKAWATKALGFARGDHKALARRAAAGTWGEDLLETFTLPERVQATIDQLSRRVGRLNEKTIEQGRELRALKEGAAA